MKSFDDEEERYKTVKPKDGEGYRYTEVNANVEVSFREIKNKLSDCNGTRTHNRLVRERTLNHLAKLAK